ncbi:cobalamin-5'-phosphate synthase [Sulfuritortus calidifontis]|uniref:Adenosylcobinamide-GDP ribazoletransferase n=1 Tax=Sulfuritortus calidifontis TaxID=1914471 RepID=A0A4R3JYS9_9PROT|nr:adenosylcobinamide-GDP ribazoletransferase [Sulfuritortus calidifontis]TCS73938.1 cobalamin-5'-phosphate synthase [Sulfuritortus calidifontis]
MRGFFLALQFLTRLPTPAVRGFQAEDLARSAAWFPAVGLLLGALLALVGFAVQGFDPWLAALLTLIAWVWLTGGLHLDGLADTFDALGAAHRDRERFLQVLSDPHVGSFGVIALVLQLMAKLVLLGLAFSHGISPWALLLIPAWARLGALWWSQSLPPLKPGLGERFTWRAGRGLPLLWLGILFALSLPFAGLWLAPLILVFWRHFLGAKIGGMTGDCLGAGVEVSEGLMLLAVVLGRMLPL